MICTKCSKEHPLTNFANDKTRITGKFPWCKSCVRQSQKDRRQTYPLPGAVFERKLCPKCKETKKYDEFCKNKANRTGRTSWCTICRQKQKALDYRTKNSRDKYLLRFYGLTIDEYKTILNRQNGICAICKKPPEDENQSLCVDHDHETGKIRGLLCKPCNLGIGNLQDDINILEAAISYLKHNEVLIILEGNV